MLLAACFGCDGEPPSPVDSAAPPPPDAAPDGALDPDAAPHPRVAAGDVCEGDDDCERGGCTHGVCSPTCSTDVECGPGLVCVGRGGAPRCTRACVAAGDCAEGLLCAVQGPAAGFCVAPGSGAAGAGCETREDCASWVCGGGQCLGTCRDGGCRSDTTCLALHTQSVCVPAGDAGDEAACRRGADCATGVCRGGRCTTGCGVGVDCPNDRVCLLYETVALCERRCADSGDCGETGVCLATTGRRLCATRGSGAPGTACDGHRECASGHCALGACTASCRDGCPDATACVTDIAGAACRPAGAGGPASPCTSGEQCASGVCGGGACSSDCAQDADCGDGARCVRFSNGRFCFPGCERTSDCPDVSYCAEGFAEGRICFWRGAMEDGASCARDHDCQSGRCETGRCLSECPGGECPAGRRCVDLVTGAWCAPTPLPLLAACEGDAAQCAEGLECTAGRCTPACAEGCPTGTVCVDRRCHPVCARDDECRPGRRCNRVDLARGYCDAPGELDVAARCDRSADCASGLCFRGRCRPPCEAGCAEGDACLHLRDDAWCVPAGDTDPGGRCATDAECASGLCIGRRCATACAGRCPAGLACRALTSGDFCVAECAPPGGCDPDEVCDPTTRRCALPGGESVAGERCEDRDACVPDIAACLDAGDGARCRAWCAPGGASGCDASESCVEIADDVGACVPAGEGGDLAPCDDHGDCASGYCLASYLEGRCARRCEDAAECGEARCVDLARDPADPLRACAAPCESHRECEAPLRCRRDLDGQGGCY